MKHWQRVSVVCAMALAAVSGAGAAEYETQANKAVESGAPGGDGGGPRLHGQGPRGGRRLHVPVHYTPTQNLLLVDSLSRLGGAAGRDAYLERLAGGGGRGGGQLLRQHDPDPARLHEKQGPITGITMVGELTVAQTKAGPAVIPFALDYGVWTANADRLSRNMKATYKARGFNGKLALGDGLLR